MHDDSTDDTHEPSAEHYRIAQGDTVPPGATVSRTDDGSVAVVATDDGEWSVHVDETTEFGERLALIAGHQGKEASECVREAIEEFAREEAA